MKVRGVGHALLAATAVGALLMATAWTASGRETVKDGRPKGPLAPRINGERWINTAPLTSSDLKGHVVLVEFWTFECVNCLRTLPAMKALQTAYADSDLVIVAVHTPELEQERVTKNVVQAVEKLGITYPVTIDTQHLVWDAFDNKYWPAMYLIDRRGVIRHTHLGELHQGTADWTTVTGWISRLIAEPS